MHTRVWLWPFVVSLSSLGCGVIDTVVDPARCETDCVDEESGGQEHEGESGEHGDEDEEGSTGEDGESGSPSGPEPDEPASSELAPSAPEKSEPSADCAAQHDAPARRAVDCPQLGQVRDRTSTR